MYVDGEFCSTYDMKSSWRKIKATLVGGLLQKYAVTISPLIKPYFPIISLHQIRSFELKWTIITMKSDFSRILLPEVNRIIVNLLHSLMLQESSRSSFHGNTIAWLFPENYLMIFEHMIFRSMYKEDNFVGI